MIITTLEKIIESLPFIVGIICCIWIMIKQSKIGKQPNMKVSNLNKISDPCGEDVLLISDMSKRESKQITLAQLRAFIKS